MTGDDPTVTFQLSDATSISITSSKTLAVDGDLMVPGVPVSLKAKKITVAGRTIDSGTADVAITADDAASGTNLLGVILDASTDAQVIITSARIRGRTIVITATATSTPDTTSGSGAGPVAQITATASATVVVSGDSVLAGTGDVTLSSKAVMQANATSDGLPSSLSSTANAAIAVPVLTTRAITQVTGTSSVTSDGLLTVSSAATTNVKANANAKDSPAGGAIAIAVVDITSHAFIDSTGPASSGSSVTVNATSDTTIDTSAIASVGGASENKDKDGNPTTADNLADGNGKVTPAGGSATQSIPVAASLAFTHLTSDTAAWVGPTGTPNPSTVIANGPAGVVTISSSSGNHLSSSADSSAVKASSASTSVGVGLAVTVANVNHKSFVTGSANIRGPTVRILATMPTTGTTQDSYTTTATSGVGDATTVAIAGSLALNVITLNRSATIADNAQLDTAYGPALDQLGDVTLTAASSSTSTTKATAHSDVFDPATAVDADNQTITLPYGLKSGSSAITTGTAVTYSAGGGTPIGGLADGGTYYAIVVSATDTETKLKLAASASDATSGTAITLDKSKATGTEHSIGTETSAQGVGIGASFGINIVGDTTTAGIGPGARLTRAGALTVSATTTDALVNLAENGSQGAQAITPVVAVSISNVTTTAQLGTGPAVTLGGAASVAATQTASATTTATGDTQASSAAIGASIAILSANHTVRATALRNLTAGGDVTLTAHGTSTTVSSATASAAGADDSSSSHGTSQDVNGQSDSQLGGANAAATRNGAGGSKDTSTPAASTADSDGNGGSSSVSVAAAVVFNLVHATAEASLGEGVTVTTTGLATLDASVNTDASAEADGQASTQGGTASIGAAVGINRAIVNNLATVGAGSTLTAKGVVLKAAVTPVTTGAATDTTQTFAAKATSGASNSTTANINGSLALNIVDIVTTAMLLGGHDAVAPAAVVITDAADVSLSAESNVASTTEALAATRSFDPATAVDFTADTITLPFALTKPDGSPLATNDKVVYHSGGGKAISGLTDGTEYFVIVKKPGVYQLSTSSGGTAIDLKTDPAATGTEHSLEVKDAPAKVGIGASVAVNLVNDTTTAGLGGSAAQPSRGASLSGAKDLTVDAAAELSLTTTAKGGAAGQVAISPTVAVEISNATTQAVLLAGPALTTSGDIELKATQKGEVESSASGDVVGSKVGIGISLVLAIPTHIVSASSGRSMRARGAVSLTATGSLTVKGEAEAAGDGETEASAQNSGGGSSNVNDKSDAQLTQAKDTQAANSPSGTTTGSTSTPKASTSDDNGASLSLAGAIVIHIVNTTSSVSLADGVEVGGESVTLASLANTDTTATAKGDTKTKASVGVGAGVAINLVTITNTASTGTAVVGTAADGVGGLTVTAGMTPVGTGTPDTTHTTSATSTSGASNASSVGVAGSFAMNLVANRTTATVGGAVTLSPTGDVTVGATSTEADTAAAKAKASGTSDAVGVGASISLNILTPSTVSATVSDGAALVGGRNITVTAIAARTVTTTVEAGTTGGTAITPAVALALILDDTATAYLGTSPTGLSATGTVTVSATHTTDATKTTGDATAAGSSVAVGAVVAIVVVERRTTAATLARGGTAGAVTVTATSTLKSESQATASARGNKDDAKKSDETANGQVNGSNPNTNGTGTGTLPSADSTATQGNGQASGKSGSSGGGVGVAAAIAVNWTTTATTASIGGGIQLTVTGAVAVTANSTTTSNAKAIGTALNTQQSDAQIGAAVGLNVADITNTASVGDATTLSGAGITVEATSPAANTFIAWGIAAAGGKSSASVAASVAIQVLTLTTSATVGAGAHLTSTEGLTVHAKTPVGMQLLALSGGVSVGGVAVGGAIAVAVLSFTTQAAVTSATATPTSLDVAKALAVQAESSLDPLNPDPGISRINPADLPQFSSLVMSGAAGTGSAAVTGSVTVDIANLSTTASLGDGVLVNQTVTGGLEQTLVVSASGTVRLVDVAGGIAATTNGSSVGIGLIVDVVNTAVGASIGTGATVATGGDATVSATSSEKFFGLAIQLAASSSAAVSGSILVLVMNSGTGTGTYASVGAGSTVRAGGNLTVSATDTADKLELYAGQIAFGSTAGVGIAAAVLVRSQRVEATVGNGADVSAAGAIGVAVAGAETSNIILIAIGGSGGQTAGIAGSATVEVLNNTTTASIGSNAKVNCVGAGCTVPVGTLPTSSVVVTSTDRTTLSAAAGMLAVGGTAGVGAGADVQVITKNTSASVGDGSFVNARGDVVVSAISSENLLSISVGGTVGGTAAVAINAAVPVLSITTTARLGASTVVVAGGNVIVSADESLTLTVVAGNIAISGTASVGAGAAVPIITKVTSATIGDLARVTALATPAQIGHDTVNAGGFTTSANDLRFNPRGPTPGDNRPQGLGGDGTTFTMPFNHGFATGQQVLYDAGGGAAINGLTSGHTYYVNVVSPTQFTLSMAPRGPPMTGLSLPNALMGESQRFVPATGANVALDSSPRFIPGSDVSGNVLTLPYQLDHALATGDAVVYSSGGGTPIGGLVDGRTYYAIVLAPGAFGAQRISLATTRELAGAGTAIPLNAAVATGRSHSVVPDGTLPAASPEQTTAQTTSVADRVGFRGVAVVATNSDTVNAIGVSAGVSGTVAVNVAGTVSVITVTTTASIGSSAKINCAAGSASCATNDPGANADQSVLVYAGNSFRQLGVAASASVSGTAAAGAGVAVGVVTLTTTATIGDGAVVNAAADVALVATGQESIIAVAAAASIGAAGGGIAGAVQVTVLTVTTQAHTGTGTTVRGAGNLLVSATDATEAVLVAASLGAGLYVGVGAGVGVAVVTKDTEAYLGGSNVIVALGQGGLLTGIDNGTINPDGSFGTKPGFVGLAVQASSSERAFGITAGVAGGFVGLAGGIGVNLFTVVVKAFIAGNTTVNQGAGGIVAGAAPNQGVAVTATDRMRTLTFAGGLGVGVVGLAAGVDVGIANVTVQSYFGAGSDVWANGSVELNALASKDIQTYALSVGGGFVGVAGAVSVWTVGAAPTKTYQQNDQGPQRGAWSAGTRYLAGDVVTFSGQTYGARKGDNSGVNNTGHSPTDNEWWALSDQDPTTGGTGSATGSADTIASGGSGGSSGGWGSVLSGAATVPTWTSATTYHQGDLVSFGGHYYVATAGRSRERVPRRRRARPGSSTTTTSSPAPRSRPPTRRTR